MKISDDKRRSSNCHHITGSDTSTHSLQRPPPFGAPVRGPFQEEEQEEEVNSLLIFPNESLLLLADPKVVHKLFFCHYPAS